ncbi:hypothetical protein CLOM_g5325 [Closterium sp. NIES-68]|nr:hypothetical protein CLOM_g5325 [Closterium sp. NIES-68]
MARGASSRASITVHYAIPVLLAVALLRIPASLPATTAAPVVQSGTPDSFYRYHYHVRRLPPWLRNHMARGQRQGGGEGAGGAGGEGALRWRQQPAWIAAEQRPP